MRSEDITPRAAFSGIRPDDLMAFWKVYADNYENISDTANSELAVLPEFASVLSLVSEEDQAAQRGVAFEMLRDAVDSGEWGPYVDYLADQGRAYGHLGLSFGAWFQAVGAVRRIMLPMISAAYEGDAEQLNSAYLGLNDFMDEALAVIGMSYLNQKESTIRDQQEAIRELSTPVLPVKPGLLILPMVGVVDTHRAYQLTQELLKAIRDTRAKVVVIDITGVPSVDSKVANHFIQTVDAAKLMGASVILTGISASIARALVTLGIDLAKLHTVGDLQSGLVLADDLLADGHRFGRVEA